MKKLPVPGLSQQKVKSWLGWEVGWVRMGSTSTSCSAGDLSLMNEDVPPHPVFLFDLVMQYLIFRVDAFNSWSAKTEKSQAAGRLLFA